MKRIRLESLVKPLPILWDAFGSCRGGFDEIDYFNRYGEQARIVESCWSIFEVAGRMEEPIPLAARRLRYFEHWGDREVVIKLHRNATWLDLWCAAERAIKKSGDLHHTFIESFEVEGNDLILFTGS